MIRTIGVEKGLSNVESFLKSRGYNVKEFETTEINDKNFLNSVDFIVSTGENENFIGIENSSTKIPIISAEGRSPENIEKQIIRIQ
ncbi:YkuS family protein [Clostridium pasteurianum]|uniref:Uncharacterized protein family (UPF0180) n=1 Tax=Clostridium pasteurianum BC1 TaxID=86416 RepID=R4K767_CLOPA|nr:YkuS family protein [Clostridium pasteurianum]AGK97526.1 Uncharacterized protein family (UPF0180) [Clostridium pasteurianum BC1]